MGFKIKPNMKNFYSSSLRTTCIGFLFAIIFACTVSQVKAQQLPIVSYFMYNKLLYNPASAGTSQSQFNANLIARTQWSDIKGAPMSFSLWSDYRFTAYRMAIGVNVTQERIGGNVNTDYNLNYAYHVKLSPKIKLSMGLRAGISNVSFNANGLTKSDEDDASISNFSAVIPKFGLGFHLYDSKFYVSLSTPDLIIADGNNVLKNNSTPFFQKNRNYALMAGYRIRLGDTYAIYPNVFAYYNPISGVRTDINALFEITDYFWIGGTYSTSNVHSLMAGTNISSRIKFGYAYGLNTGSTSTLSFSTHEINLMFTLDNLFKKKKQ